MKGVTFGSYHSFNSWGLILQSKEIKAPKPKINQIDIEGGDGGYYGGNVGYVCGGGGSGWLGGVPSITYKGTTYNSSTSNGVNSGNGKAKISYIG